MASADAGQETSNAGRRALANKTGRIVWALLAKGGVYQAPAMAA